ncbi:hypothetical protein N9A94_06665 [Akkermansiaceae bacterium]|nr:hypothetical protein [Akkermansiaceae bacterium]MDA7888150.1 hypothetical protein [Akkermansiaceae bacterium]
MKNSTITKSLGLMIGLSSLLPAAQITWDSSVQMYQGSTVETFVSTKGTSLVALNGTITTGDATVNGVTFIGADTDVTVTGPGGHTIVVVAGIGNDNAFQDGEFDGNAEITNLIGSAIWQADSVTFGGLTIGEEYQIQLFGNDARGNRSTNFIGGVGDGLGSATAAATLQLNNSPTAGAPTLPATEVGDSIIGTFTADAETQSFNVFGTNSGDIANLGLGDSRAHVNAIQLRLLPPDLDEDGIPNQYETDNGLDPNDPSDATLDPDMDGLNNLREFENGTLINNDDTDGDNLLDGEEVDTHGTSPILADTDGDTLNDDVELVENTNPLLLDSDFDSLSDGEEINTHSTDPNLADSDFDGINDSTEILISGTDPNLDTSVPTLDPNAVDLLAYWDFNDDSNAAETVDLANGYVGNLNAGTTFTADALGHTGQAGDHSIYLGATNAAGTGVSVELGEFFNLTTINDQFSISFWQKLDAGEPTGATSSVGAGRYGVDRAIMAHLPFTDGQMFFDHGGGTANRIAGPPVMTIDWQAWNHITLVKDGTTKQIWINGSLALSGEIIDPEIANNHHTILLGVDDLDRNVVGYVDDFAFYADALDSTQILALANNADPQNLDAALVDTDTDGMPDSYENIYGLNPAVNDADLDLDNDQLTNIEEFNLGTFPNDNDTDDDNYIDGVETDTGTWVSASNTGSSPFMSDSDGDALLDGAENPDLPTIDQDQAGTDPNLADTDGDTYTDGEEIAFGSDPRDPSSLAATAPDIILYYDFNGDSLNRVEDAPDATLGGPATLSADSEGFSGNAGDQSLDLGATAGAGAHAVVAAGLHFQPIEINNTVAISWWQKRVGGGVESAAFSAPAFTGGRGLQSHAPWNNGTFYVDLMGFRRTLADPTITDQWQHFVIQQDAEGTVELWIDGTLNSEWPQGAAGQLFSLTGEIFIGATAGGANNMTGQLDDFAIFSGPLPGPHIQTLATGVSVGDFYNTGPQALVITSFTRNGNAVSLTWNSNEGETYAVKYSFDMLDWGADLDDAVPAGAGAETTYTFNLNSSGLAGESTLFFRVER